MEKRGITTAANPRFEVINQLYPARTFQESVMQDITAQGAEPSKASCVS